MSDDLRLLIHSVEKVYHEVTEELKNLVAKGQMRGEKLRYLYKPDAELIMNEVELTRQARERHISDWCDERMAPHGQLYLEIMCHYLDGNFEGRKCVMSKKITGFNFSGEVDITKLDVYPLVHDTEISNRPRKSFLYLGAMRLQARGVQRYGPLAAILTPERPCPSKIES